MNVEPAIVYTVVGGLVTAIVVLYGVVIWSLKMCHKERIESNHRVGLLTEHTIAQQVDIKAFQDDRVRRGIKPIDLQSEKTEFYKQHMQGEAEI